jgi:hypothetical protein
MTLKETGDMMTEYGGEVLSIDPVSRLEQYGYVCM